MAPGAPSANAVTKVAETDELENKQERQIHWWRPGAALRDGSATRPWRAQTHESMSRVLSASAVEIRPCPGNGGQPCVADAIIGRGFGDSRAESHEEGRHDRNEACAVTALSWTAVGKSARVSEWHERARQRTLHDPGLSLHELT